MPSPALENSLAVNSVIKMLLLFIIIQVLLALLLLLFLQATDPPLPIEAIAGGGAFAAIVLVGIVVVIIVIVVVVIMMKRKKKDAVTFGEDYAEFTKHPQPPPIPDYCTTKVMLRSLPLLTLDISSNLFSHTTAIKLLTVMLYLPPDCTC